MTERKYSISEIDKMRGAVRLKLQPGPMQPYNGAELSARVEDRLRTYMLAGVDPDELVKEAGGSIIQVGTGHYVARNIVVENNRLCAGINQPTTDKPSKGQ